MFTHGLAGSTWIALPNRSHYGLVIRFGEYVTFWLKRFGDYPTDLKPEAMPTRTTLPV